MNHNMTSKTVGILLVALVCSQGMAFAGSVATSEMEEVAEYKLVHGNENQAAVRKIAWATCLENYFSLLEFLVESYGLLQGYASTEQQKEEDLDYCKRHFEGEERSSCDATALDDYKKRLRSLRQILVHLSLRGVHLALSSATCLGIL